MRDRVNNAVLVEFPPTLIGEKLSYLDVRRRLQSACRTLRISVTVVKCVDVDEWSRQHILVSGSFEFTNKRKWIQLVLYVSPSRTHLHFTPAFYKFFLFQITTTIKHEMLHKEQFLRSMNADRRVRVSYSKRIRSKRREDIEYLRRWHEIDAYAHDLAHEIFFYYPGIDSTEIVQYLDQYHRLTAFQLYARTFRGTDWDDIRKTLVGRTLKWIPFVDLPWTT